MTALRVSARMIARGIKHTLDHKVSSVLILLLVIALIFVSTAKFSSPSNAQASQQKVGGAPTTTEQYFKGQATYNSTMIWSVLSDDLKTRAAMNGATQDDLQAQLDDAKSSGRGIDQIDYIGSYNMQDGRSMQFYVATVHRSPNDTASDPIFYVFTLDTDGKIANIE